MIVNALDKENLEKNRNCRVFCDSVEIDRVAYADTDQGVVVYYALSFDKDAGEINAHIIRGKVLIVEAGAKVNGKLPRE